MVELNNLFNELKIGDIITFCEKNADSSDEMSHHREGVIKDIYEDPLDMDVYMIVEEIEEGTLKSTNHKISLYSINKGNVFIFKKDN